ncbi:hypothetical protein B0H13DRAFT_2354379 [Mycena leptocephala]|nr:hypothetical protein B0H13DRAFT_2354379 [Mycena leptocephala]
MSNNPCRDLILYDPSPNLYKGLVLKAGCSNLQTGERWINIDYLVAYTLAHAPLIITYDIACQLRRSPHMCAYQAETDWASCAP